MVTLGAILLAVVHLVILGGLAALLLAIRAHRLSTDAFREDFGGLLRDLAAPNEADELRHALAEMQAECESRRQVCSELSAKNQKLHDRIAELTGLNPLAAIDSGPPQGSKQ